MMFVAIAGPLSNLILAVVFGILFFGLLRADVLNDEETIATVLLQMVRANIILAIFNMIPLPPLDGSRVMAWILPDSLRPGYVSLERYGMLIVMLLLFTRVFDVIYRFAFPPLWRMVTEISDTTTSFLGA